jgi:Tol biopolymer transport system component
MTNAGALYLGLAAAEQDIVVASIDLATGEETAPQIKPIQRALGTNIEPAWSPDGKSLAYISWRTNNPIFGDPRILAIRSLDTGDTRELKPSIAYFDQLSWSPDGRAVVTAGTDLKGQNWIFRVDTRTGESTPLVRLPLGFERACPQWSRDGTRIYYRVPLAEAASDVAFIERVLATGSEREIARGDLGSINLSPDGRWIAAQQASPSPEGDAVVVIPVDGGAAREVLRTSPAQRILRFSGIPWTPDGHALLVRKIVSGDIRRSTSELWLVSVDQTPPRKLAIDTNQWKAGNMGVISLSPDGRKLAFLSGDVKDEVWALENFLPAVTAKSPARKPR